MRRASALTGETARYAVSPLVIAMRESQAAAMGHPAEAVGWGDLMRRASADPEFWWSHAPATTASGLLALIAEFYGGAKKQEGLTTEDLQDEATREFVRNVESAVRRYWGEPESPLPAARPSSSGSRRRGLQILTVHQGHQLQVFSPGR